MTVSFFPYSQQKLPLSIPQFRHNLDGEQEHDFSMREGQQQVFRATFPGVRNCVRELLGVRTDALARKFHETHDMAVKDETDIELSEFRTSLSAHPNTVTDSFF